jgi:uncharacterized tellurite resistance protein B-like protein
MIAKLEGSALAKAISGHKYIDEESVLNYCYALLNVAGADDISDSELEWLMDEFIGILGLDDEKYRALFKAYRPRLNSITKVIDKVQFKLSFDFKTALIYDALKMALADQHLAQEELDEFKNAATLLEIPLSTTRTIEGLVRTERSLLTLQHALFEVSEHNSDGSSADANRMYRFTMGTRSAPYELQILYGKALLCIAGADDEVSEEERDWFFKIFLPEAKPLPEVVAELKDFDGVENKGKLLEYTSELSSFTTDINFNRTLLYNAIRMAKADGDYADDEKEAVQNTANWLNQPKEMATTLEYLINMEDNVYKLRTALFGI